MARTDTLGNFLTDIADAIRTKAGTSDTITASDFDTAISNIPSGVDINDYFLPTVSKGNFDTAGVIKSIIAIPPLEFSGTDCSNMFSQLSMTESIDCSKFDTSNVTNMVNMFLNCRKLKSLDLSNFETPNVTNMGNLFNGCEALRHLDIRKMTFDSVTNTKYMFNYIPNDCEIIVKSQTEKDIVLSIRSNLTNVKTVAEYENQ